MTANFVVYLLFIHFVADFVCQSHYTGTHKSKDNIVLALHILTYTAVVLILTSPAIMTRSFDLHLPLYYAVINGFLHWPTDWVTSRLSSKYHREGRHYAFWKVIGIDQLIHYACLLYTAEYFLNL